MISSLHKRILDISYRHKLSHLSSNLTACEIIDEIYGIKEKDDIFILSNSHASLALFVCLEKYEGLNAEELKKKHGTHANRDLGDKIYCSGGSLGCGISMATGFALSNRKRKIYCLISDGEAFSEPVYGALNFKAKYNLKNLIVYVNMNGFGCIESIDMNRMTNVLTVLDKDIRIRYTHEQPYEFLKTEKGHFYNLTSEDMEKYK